MSVVRYDKCKHCGGPCSSSNTSIVPVVGIYYRKGLRHGFMSRKRVCKCGATVRDDDLQSQENIVGNAKRDTFHLRYPHIDPEPAQHESKYELHEMYKEVADAVA